jgi:hypothetical protein
MSEVRCYYKWNAKRAKELESWVNGHQERHVVFFEDDPAVVHWNLSHPRIRCFSISEKNQKATFEKIVWELLYLPFNYDQPNHPLFKELARIRTEINYQAYDFADQGQQLLQNYGNNLAKPTQLAQDLFGKFKGVPAIICGGGPSLISESSSLKRLQKEAVIIGCGAGMEVLLNMGIEPHFAAHVDAAPLHKFRSTNTPLFYQLRTSNSVVEKHKGPRFLLPGSGNFPLERWLHQNLGLEEVMDGGLMVGTLGVKVATLLGCNPIILAGIDLAATPGKLYAPGVKTSATTETFVPMKNREGRSVVSRPDWILAAVWLDLFAKSHPDREWGTISSRGLDIPSIPVVKLEDIRGLVTEVSLQTPLIDGSSSWKKIVDSLQRCKGLCQQILQEMEKIYPKNPMEHHVTLVMEHDLSEELGFQLVLNPLWHYWQHVIARHNLAGECGLYLNRILFFNSICP